MPMHDDKPDDMPMDAIARHWLEHEATNTEQRRAMAHYDALLTKQGIEFLASCRIVWWD